MAEPTTPTPPRATGTTAPGTPVAGAPGMGVELNGVNVIAEHERGGTPRQLFWPWCAANIAVLGMSYGSWILGFGISFWQASAAGVIGTVFSFLLVGLGSLSGKRGSAPTMIVSRAAFGVRGNALPGAVSYLLLVGWEIVLCTTATLATATVLGRLGWGGGTLTKIAAFLLVAAVIMVAGIFGFQMIMRLQAVLTVAVAVLTVGYIALTLGHLHWSVVTAVPAGSAQAFIGALVFAVTGFGLGWVNSSGDYSRYLPRSANGTAVVAWTTLGASVAPVVLVVYGLLLAGSDPALKDAVGNDPIGALTEILPTWYLVPFAVVAIGGILGGAVLDIYSSGLTLLTLGLRVPRWTAVLVDGVLMTVGTVYVVWVAGDFIHPFIGFLTTLGVPIAAWCGVFLADLSMRRRDYAEADLFDPAGRYGSVGVPAVVTAVVGTVVGWGLVTNSTAGWLSWQGYLLGPFRLGGREGDWAYANLGVLAALAIGFVGYRLTAARAVRHQEALAD